VACDSDGVATVVFSRPPSNYFDLVLLSMLADELERLDSDPSCRAIALLSDGRHFCVGMEFSQGKGSELSEEQERPDLYECGLRLFSISKPIVCGLQGKTIGGGLGLAMVADFRVMARTASVTANFSRLGLFPGFGLTYTLPDTIGRQHARDVLMSGRWIDAEDALSMGLCDETAPPDNLRAATTARAQTLAMAAPLSVTALKPHLDKGRVDHISESMAAEYKIQIRLGGTSDFAEGFRAWRDQREPIFLGQ
jgi:enoyl-CoA hydratase/carnithine racemase